MREETPAVMDIQIVISFFIFFSLQFSYTQEIYERINLLIVAVSLLIPVGLLFLKHYEIGDIIRVINLGCLTFYYLIFVLLIKGYYKKINSILIKKGHINILHANKKFTYVLWDSDIPIAGKWWDKARAANPSWLDTSLSYLLLMLPVCFSMIIAYIINVYFPLESLNYP